MGRFTGGRRARAGRKRPGRHARRWAGAIALACAAAAGAPAYAGGDALRQLIDIMERKGTLTAEEADLLRRAAEEDAAAIAEVKADAKKEVEAATRDLPEIDLKEGVKLSTKDGNFSWKLGGRIQADAAFYNEDSRTPDLGNETEFRRARLEMEATLWKVWGFKLQYDFTGTGESGIRDAFIEYMGLPNTAVRAGNFKEPFSLEELTSSKYITFMERALPNALVPGRAIGAGASTRLADLVTIAGGVFGESVEDADVAGVDSGIGTTGRVTLSPVHRGGRVLHLGAAASWRAPNDTERARFRERFESHANDLRIVDTDFGTGDLVHVEDIVRYGLEAAAVYDRVSLQGEYIRTDVGLRARAMRPDPTFDGYYVYGSMFLTPDSRAYKFEDGAFDKVTPSSIVGKGGLGAWELALRYSALDLTDSGVTGGAVDDLTVGLNWYPTKNIRFMGNYVTVLHGDRYTFGGGAFAHAEPAVFQLRGQVFW